MATWKDLLVKPDAPIRKAIETIDTAGMQIALVVDEQGCLLGTVTDGDVRRGILKGISLEQPVRLIMGKNPVIAHVDDNREKILGLMRQLSLHQIPVLDSKRRVRGIEILDLLLRTEQKDNTVVLMAGGLGMRLRPLTENTPKPLLKVGNKPILETILQSFISYGFHRFFLSVNYKDEMVKEYFGDGSRWNVSIRYLDEDQKLGTAGALGLLPEKLAAPIIVMNGDLLTNINFQQLLSFHKEHSSAATMCIREYDFQVPYGVVSLKNQVITGIDEKPVHRFFVNAGIYVLDLQSLALIPKGQPFDMPQLFEKAIEQKMNTAGFPIREYWLDIGRIDDLERANQEYPQWNGDKEKAK
ncbi:MAG: nucleotidyltransferase family protein [Candidatus Omnitrophota bacterium]